MIYRQAMKNPVGWEHVLLTFILDPQQQQSLYFRFFGSILFRFFVTSDGLRVLSS
jgi:hypothetical protein